MLNLQQNSDKSLDAPSFRIPSKIVSYLGTASSLLRRGSTSLIAVRVRFSQELQCRENLLNPARPYNKNDSQPLCPQIQQVHFILY